MKRFVAAVDLGASSGRVCIGFLEDGQLCIEVVHRFTHESVSEFGALHWQWSHIVSEVEIGLRKAQEQGELLSVGIDFWAVDYGLLANDLTLASAPYCYRDSRADIFFKSIPEKLTREYIYEKTGIQYLYFNTIYQLAASNAAGELVGIRQFLMLPDLLNHHFCGSLTNDVTNASTTQLLNAHTRDWDRDLIEKVGLPFAIFPKIHKPGDKLGVITGHDDLDGIQVIAVASHDTGSAVAGTPLDPKAHSAYISSGTWSLVGMELTKPVTNARTLEYNITNELGAQDTVRFIKNVAGLWLIEESLRYWKKQGLSLGITDLVIEASGLPRALCLIDATDPKYTKPGPVPEWIAEYATKTGQYVPKTPAEFAITIFESLALAYRQVIHELEVASGNEVSEINIVGGGSENALLNQLTADALGVRVTSGPREATALGNIIVQLISLGQIRDLQEGRSLIANSPGQRIFQPQAGQDWTGLAKRLKGYSLLLSSSQGGGK